MRTAILVLMVTVIGLSGCTEPEKIPFTDHDQSVWAVDFIRILPGGEDDYLTNIRENWAQARDMALANEDVLSFNALSADADSSLGWHIMLMTQYVDSARWANREEIFRLIFESPAYERVQIDRPSSELREFVNSGVVLRPVVSSSISR